MRPSRRIVVALLAVVVLGLAAESAAAETFWLLGESFRVTGRSLSFHAEGVEPVSCPVTLEGTFTSATFPATSRTGIGRVTRASLGTCTGGTASVLTETLPWTLQYDSIRGTLPNITGMTTRIIGGSFRVTSGGISCLARSEEAEPMRFVFVREVAGELLEARADESARIRLTGSLCELVGRGWLTGSGTDRIAGSTEEEPVLYLNGVGNALVVPGTNALANVSIAAGGTANLQMGNNLQGELLTFQEEPRSGNSTKFTVEGGGTTCGITIQTLQGRNGSCQVRIRREAGAVMGDTVPIIIRYRTSLSFPFIAVQQSFNVTAS